LKFTLTQGELFSFEDVHKWAGSMSFSSERIDTSVAKKKEEKKKLGRSSSGNQSLGTHTIVAYDPSPFRFIFPNSSRCRVERRRGI
jgi:hypothetical protein